jgi:hypothetical protein
MKLRLLTTLFASAAVAACAAAPTTTIQGSNPADGMMPPDDGTMMPAAQESDDPANQPPHSLGTIILGESHGSGTGKSNPIVSATFFPDAMLTRACTTKLEADCVIQKVAKCTKVSTTTTGCNSNEVCTLDNATCSAVCKPYVTCEQACGTDEVCKAADGTGTGTGTATGQCVKIQSFDAGPLAFSGTTTSITMFPPYKFETSGVGGAPFLGGATIEVQASGATDAGFEKFDEKFTATTFIQTSPQLSKIPRQQVFGTGPLPIAWAPANDTIVITLTGVGGSATCKVQDSLGKFDVPRSVVDAVQKVDGSTTTSSSGSISVSIARQHRDVKKDKHAKGKLDLTEVKPDGWLELITSSSETASFQGCPTNQTICPDTSESACTDLSYDRNNCGACGHVCTSSQTCSNGTCTGGTTGSTCSSCRSNALAGSCSSQYSTCSATAACGNLANCAYSCTTSSCVASCKSTYSTGVTAYQPLENCLYTYCSGSCGF